jgi:ribosomal protein S3AE
MPTPYFFGHANVGRTPTSRWSKLLMDLEEHVTQTLGEVTNKRTVSERKVIRA